MPLIKIRRPEDKKNKIIFLVGPTAVGKSKIAVTLAKKINAEIISCDSMQIYKGMDIITSKPSKALTRLVRHHLIGTVKATKVYDVARYRKDALEKIKNILKVGRVPLFTGGTGLYLSVLVDGIFKSKCRDLKLRKTLYRQAEEKGSAYLHQRLKAADPQAAERIHPNDARRIVRALEVFLTTGKPISLLQQERTGLADEYNVQIFCLNMPREKLYQRIEQRVDKMFTAGLVAQVKRLLKSRLSRTASFAIGIRELKGYFDGVYDLAQVKRLIKQNTRQYAKRQLTWFRKDKRINWIEIKEKDTTGQIAAKICRQLN